MNAKYAHHPQLKGSGPSLKPVFRLLFYFVRPNHVRIITFAFSAESVARIIQDLAQIIKNKETQKTQGYCGPKLPRSRDDQRVPLTKWNLDHSRVTSMLLFASIAIVSDLPIVSGD